MSEDVYKDTHDNLKESEFKLNNKTWNVANLALRKHPTSGLQINNVAVDPESAGQTVEPWESMAAGKRSHQPV